MSAPQIPNLSHFRRGGIRSGGRGTLSHPSQDERQPASRRPNQDTIIQSTDNDAATSRLSAVQAGYLNDPFAQHLSSTTDIPRRLPLMNRGTYVRTTAIDRIVSAFLASSPKNDAVQIISLGAGSDTRYFRLKQQHPDLDLVYHEIDFPTNTATKISHIRMPQFSQLLSQSCAIDTSTLTTSENITNLTSPSYNIHSFDLRNLTPTLDLSSTFPTLSTALPTLLISECCLCYLTPHDANNAATYFTSLFPSTTPLSIVIYEPIRPHDPFGRTMISNLAARGIVLETIERYADPQAQRKRLEGHGFTAEAVDVNFIWKHWIDEKEKDRVEALEWMDEVEEFELLGRHYVVAWGWRGFSNSLAWADVAGKGSKDKT